MLKNWCLTILMKKSRCFVTKLTTLLKIRIEGKKDTSSTRIQSITMVKTIY